VIEVVIDTNVLVAAFRSSLGSSYRLLQMIERRQWRPVISPALALEYEAVLRRSIDGLGMTFDDVDDFIEYLLQPCQARADLFPLETHVAGPRR
jgi:predicted nucleic acid-binding protein